MRGSGGTISSVQGSVDPDEFDRALVDALQARPRAPWSELGRVLRADPSTVARRWARLESAGVAWLSAYAAPELTWVAHVDVDCEAGAVDEVAARLCQEECVFSVERVAGGCDLRASITALDAGSLHDLVNRRVAVDGVRAARTRLALSTFREGGEWTMRALEPEQRRALANPDPRQTGPWTDLHRDARIVHELDAEPRISFADLAERLGVSEATARRRCVRLESDGHIVIRCDTAPVVTGEHTVATFCMSAPSRRLSEIGRNLSALAHVRLCVAVSGEGNLMVISWLPDVADVVDFETEVGSEFPDLQVLERDVTLRAHKRMGKILDERGRNVGQVPMRTWQVGAG